MPRPKIVKSDCRKCGQDYYYVAAHLDKRCGVDICHVCGMIRELYPIYDRKDVVSLRNYFF